MTTKQTDVKTHAHMLLDISLHIRINVRNKREKQLKDNDTFRQTYNRKSK